MTKKNVPASAAGIAASIALIPLIAAVDSAIAGLGLGLALVIVFVATKGVSLLTRTAITNFTMLAIFVISISALSSCIELIMHAFAYDLHQTLGIFIPLLASSCLILFMAENVVSAVKHQTSTILDVLTTSITLLVSLTAVGALRELIGKGTLLSDAQLIFGNSASTWQVKLFGKEYRQFLVALLPPGAFLVAGFLMAVKNSLTNTESISNTNNRVFIKGAKRVRTTGHIN